MINHKKYRWMSTSSGKIVFGGKSAEQNEEVVNWVMDSVKEGEDYLVMHTLSPGSTFAILYDMEYDKRDIEECAVFCACYSRAWRDRKKKAVVDIFKASDIIKKVGMKEGTFGFLNKEDRKTIELRLCLSLQKGKIRGIPYQPGNKSCLVCLYPGKIPKEEAAKIISGIIGFKTQEILEALPTGGFRIETCK